MLTFPLLLWVMSVAADGCRGDCYGKSWSTVLYLEECGVDGFFFHSRVHWGHLCLVMCFYTLLVFHWSASLWYIRIYMVHLNAYGIFYTCELPVIFSYTWKLALSSYRSEFYLSTGDLFMAMWSLVPACSHLLSFQILQYHTPVQFICVPTSQGLCYYTGPVFFCTALLIINISFCTEQSLATSICIKLTALCNAKWKYSK